MKKILTILILLLPYSIVLILLSCEEQNNPVQEIDKTSDIADHIVYGDYEDYGEHYDDGTAFYIMRTTYRDCKITDCGTFEYIDKIMEKRRKDVMDLQREYDSLKNKAEADYQKLKEKTE